MKKQILTLILIILFKGPRAQADHHLNLLTRLGVPTDMAAAAINYYKNNQHLFENKSWLSMIDFRQHSAKKRFYLFDLKSKRLYRFQVAHGMGSDKNHDGYAENFSNTPRSRMSSLGYYKVTESYKGKRGLSVRLDGLSVTNSKARQRAIVIHGANYVRDNGHKTGRSWGCPAVNHKLIPALVQRIKNGSLLVAYY